MTGTQMLHYYVFHSVSISASSFFHPSFRLDQNEACGARAHSPMICVVTLSMPLISVAAASGWRPFAKVVAQETIVDLNSSSTDRNSAQVHCVTGFGNSAASVVVAAAAVNEWNQQHRRASPPICSHNYLQN